MPQKMNFLDMASWILCTVAGLHLGLIGALNYNVFDSVLGAGSMAERVVYIIIGLLSLYSLGHMLKFMKK